MSTQLDNNNDALSGSLLISGNSPPVNSVESTGSPLAASQMDAILDRVANTELTPDQRKRIDIELVRYAISSVYNDGIDELTIDDRDPGKSVSGRFVDRISQNRAKVYDYTLTKTDSGYKCIYKLNEDDSSDLEEEEDSSMQ